MASMYVILIHMISGAYLSDQNFLQTSDGRRTQSVVVEPRH